MFQGRLAGLLAEVEEDSAQLFDCLKYVLNPKLKLSFPPPRSCPPLGSILPWQLCKYGSLSHGSMGKHEGLLPGTKQLLRAGLFLRTWSESDSKG
jgi:hypothetical protein